MFRFFDNDREGVISIASLRLALQRLNVDPTDAAFAAFAAKHDPTASGFVSYGPLSKALVSCDEGNHSAGGGGAGAGAGVMQRWGAEGKDRWGGYDRSRIAGTLANLNQPSFLDQVGGSLRPSTRPPTPPRVCMSIHPQGKSDPMSVRVLVLNDPSARPPRRRALCRG